MKIPLKAFSPPNKDGEFGAIRKYDRHTGTDLYCREGSEVYAIEDGTVVNVVDFTGEKANSPWWRDTKAILIEGKHGVICYGEIEPCVKIGQKIKEGILIGRVKRVLKKDKGKPTSMLHIELYKHGTIEPVWWKLEETQPKNLLDPMVLLK